MSKKIKLNEELTVTYPDGFHVMDEEEKKKLNAIGGIGEVITDPDRHIILSFGWKKTGGLISKMFSAENASKEVEKNYKSAMKPYDYHFGDRFSRTIAGEKAEGFSFGYIAQEIEMYAESYVLKHKKGFYYIHYYSRTSVKEENAAVLNDILDSAVFES